MPRMLRVTNWKTNYETHDTRKLKSLAWVKVSNNQCDPGYARLMQRPDGPQIFGAWVAILQTASRCKQRGCLAEGDGTPYDIESLAFVTRFPVELMRTAVEVLTTQVKWLEWVSDLPGDSTGESGEIRSRIESNGTESNGTELNRTSDLKEVSSPRNSLSINTGKCAADIRKLAATTKPKTSQDRTLVAQAAMLMQVGPLQERAVWDAFEAVRVQGAKIRKPIAYFRECLTEHATKQHLDLCSLLASVRPPPEMLAVFDEKPDPRLCTEPP